MITPRPLDSINPKKKSEHDYILEWGKHIETSTNNHLISDVQKSSMRELRTYGLGTNDKSRYMSAIVNVSSDQRDGPTRKEEQVNYSNINWDEASPAPKYRHIVVNKFMNMDHVIDLVDMSSDGIDKKTSKKWDSFIRAREKDFGVLMDVARGIDPTQKPEEPFLPTTIEELTLIDRMGGFKLASEIVHKKISIANFNHSDWPEIKRDMLGCAFDFNYIACKTYYCESSGRVKTRYADPINMNCSNNPKGDSSASYFIYEIVSVPIHELRVNPSFKDKDEDFFSELGRKNMHKYGFNDHQDISNKFGDENIGYRYLYDDFCVDVIDFEFKTVDTEYTTVKKKGDDTRYYKARYGEKYDSEKKKTITKDTIKVYRGKKIIGAEIVYDYGPAYYVPYGEDGDCSFSFYLKRIPGKSMMETMRGDIDGMLLISYKLQDALAKAPASGIAIEYESLLNIQRGGKEVSPFELLRIRRKTGEVIYRSSAKKGLTTRPTGGQFPFKELNGGIGPLFRELLEAYEHYNRKIQSNTGINEIVDASSPNPEVTARQSDLANQATNNALSTMYAAYKWVKKEVSLSMAKKTQILVKHQKRVYEAYLPIVGSSDMEVVKIQPNDYIVKMGCVVKMKPTDYDVREFRDMAIESMRNGEIGEVEYFILKDYFVDGRIEEAVAFITYRKKKRAEEISEAKMAEQDNASKGQQQIVEAKQAAELEAHKQKNLSDLEKELSIIREKAKLGVGVRA